MEPIIVETTLSHPIQKVWDAITIPGQMKEWYFDMKGFDLKEGNVFEFYEPGGNNQFFHQCKIMEIEPLKKFKHTWTHPNHSKGVSTITWNLSPTEDGTKVQLVHDGTENFADAGPAFTKESYEAGWNALVKDNLRLFLNGIKKLTFHTSINAPIQKVWDNLFTPDTYSKWCAPFSEGSQIKGELKQDGRVYFLNADNDGMYSDVIYFQEPKMIVFRHIGMVKNMEELPISKDEENWTGSTEQYHLTEVEDNTTKLYVEVEITADHTNYMNEAFPKALTILKEISEK